MKRFGYFNNIEKRCIYHTSFYSAYLRNFHLHRKGQFFLGKLSL